MSIKSILKVLALFIYLFFLAVTCISVWTAAAGKVPGGFSITCSIIYFVFHVASIAYLAYRWVKEGKV